MNRFLILLLCFVFALPVAAQSAIPTFEEFYNAEKVLPVARFGFGEPKAIAYSPDGEAIVITTGAGITFYDRHLDERLYIDTHDHLPQLVAFNADGTRLATADHDVYIWDTTTGRLLDVLPVHSVIGGIALSPDGRQVAVTANWASNFKGILIFEEGSYLPVKRIAQDSYFTSNVK